MYSNINNDNWEIFLKKYMKLTLTEEKVFVNAILTYSERQEIQKRIRIFEELFKNELTQKAIAEKLKVSTANVTRGVNTIRSTNYDLKGLFTKLKKNDNELHEYGTDMGEKGWGELLNKYNFPENLEEMRWWMAAVLTYAERDEIAKRVLILEELYKGELPQHEMAKKLNVSHANVSRGVNTIRSIQLHFDLKSVVEKVSK
jgi:Trp operon repressor